MIYNIALFLHITGALMLFSSVSIEWLCIISIRRTQTFETVKELIYNYSKLTVFNLTAALLILIPGIYMMAVVWKNAAWITVALIGIVLLAVVGGAVAGRKMKEIKKHVSEEPHFSAKLRSLLNSNSLIISLKMRTAIFLGIIFLMAAKPDFSGSVITLIISVIAGFFPFKTGKTVPVVRKVSHNLKAE